MDKEKEKKKTTTSSRQNNTKKNNTSKNQNLNQKKTNNNVKKQNGNQKNNAVSKNVSVPSKKSSNKQSESAKKNTVGDSNPKKSNVVQRNANIQGKKTNKVSSSHSDVKKNASKSQAVTNKSPKKKTNSSPKLSNQNVEKKNITQKKTKKVLENKNVKTAIKKEAENRKPNVSTNLQKEIKEKKPLEKVKLKEQETTNQNIITTKSLDIVKNTEKVSKAKKKTISIVEEPKEEIKKKKKIYKKKVNFDTAQPKNKKDVKEVFASKKKEQEKQLKSVAKKHVNTKLVWLLFIITFTGAFAFSTINIVNKSIDKTVTLKEQEEIEEMTVMEELPEDETKQEIVNAPKENVISDYWKYVRLPLMKVDFNELLAKNEETVAFLKVNGTNINYPVVQTKDNTFYLDHSYDKTSNDAGWVFMDYRNKISDFDDNTIIYAHGMTSFSSENTTMFGSLRKILKSDWYENTDNYVIYLSTPTISTLWQVFSVYSIPTETYYLTTNFGTKKSYKEFINTLVGRSVFDFNAEVNAEDKILTLSTCYDSETKVVMHAKLIKKQNLGE